MPNLLENIITLRDRCYMTICREKPARAKTVCHPVTGVDEAGNWQSCQNGECITEENVVTRLEPSMDTALDPSPDPSPDSELGKK